jgi:hypothetical protein
VWASKKTASSNKQDPQWPWPSGCLEKGRSEAKEKAEKQQLAKELQKQLKKAATEELEKQQIQQQKEARAQHTIWQKPPFRALPRARNRAPQRAPASPGPRDLIAGPLFKTYRVRKFCPVTLTPYLIYGTSLPV